MTAYAALIAQYNGAPLWKLPLPRSMTHHHTITGAGVGTASLFYSPRCFFGPPQKKIYLK